MDPPPPALWSPLMNDLLLANVAIFVSHVTPVLRTLQVLLVVC